MRTSKRKATSVPSDETVSKRGPSTLLSPEASSHDGDDGWHVTREFRKRFSFGRRVVDCGWRVPPLCLCR